MKKQNEYQSDTVMKDFWRDSERFADLCNGLLFHGQTVIDEVMEADSEQATTVQNRSVQRRRDLIKIVKIDDVSVMIGIENLQTRDKTMPFRDLEYTSLKYSIRLKDKSNELYPIVTIVMYYGSGKLKVETELKDILNIPEEIEEYFNNWKSTEIDAKEVNFQLFHHKEVRDFFEGVQQLYGWNKEIETLKGLE